MAIATVNDVELALRRPIAEGDARVVEKLLDRVELRIRARWRNLLELVALDSVARGVVSQVEAESVARVMRDESGGLYKSEAEDGYRYELNFWPRRPAWTCSARIWTSSPACWTGAGTVVSAPSLTATRLSGTAVPPVVRCRRRGLSNLGGRAAARGRSQSHGAVVSDESSAPRRP